MQRQRLVVLRDRDGHAGPQLLARRDRLGIHPGGVDADGTRLRVPHVGCEPSIAGHDIGRSAAVAHDAVLEADHLVGELDEPRHPVRDEHERRPPSAELVQAFDRARPELEIARGQALVEHEDVRRHERGEREAQAGAHARRVAVHRYVP
jgi:hypothetical protein